MSSRLSLEGAMGNEMVRLVVPSPLGPSRGSRGQAGCDASQESAPVRGASDRHNP